MSNKLTVQELRQALEYVPETGDFRRIGHQTGRKPKNPSRAGSLHAASGYWLVCVLGRQYKAHRLAWLYMTGEWPNQTIDHIDGDRANNRWGNLRDVSRAANYRNKRRAKSNSKTGLLGVSPNNGRFQARICTDGRIQYLGCFATPEEAHEAYVQAKRLTHDTCTI